MTGHTARRPPSYAAYQLDGCRCEDCRDARRAYTRRRREDPRPPYVGAATARRHIEELRAAGIGLKTIAARSGISHGAITKLVYGDRGRPPSKRVRRETEQKILSVTIADQAPGGRVDATATWEHVETLLGRGWTRKAIAHAIGQTGAGLQLGRDTIQRRHADTIRALLDQPVPPRRTRHGIVEVEQPEPPATVPTPAQVDLPIWHEEGDTTWMADGACRFPTTPTWMFFPGKGDNGTVAAARAVCATCPVTEDCLAYALRNNQSTGIWGGTTARERRGMKAPRPCAECGRLFVARTGQLTVCSDDCRRTRHNRIKNDSYHRRTG